MAKRQTEEEQISRWWELIREREVALNGRIDYWDKYLRFYRHDMDESEAPEDDNVFVNYLFGIARVVLPSIYFKNPDVLIRPCGGTPLPYAQALELGLNRMWELIDFEAEARTVVLDSLFCGLGWMKFGFKPAIEREPRSPVDEEFVAVTEESLFDEEFWDALERPKRMGPKEVDQRIRDDIPFGVRGSPKDLLVDPLCGGQIKKARWIVHKILRPVSEVKESRLYSRSLTSSMEGTVSLSELNEVNRDFGRTSVQSQSDRIPPSYEEMVYLYEIWDAEKGELKVLDSWNMQDGGNKKYLRKEKNPYNIDGFCAELLIFNEDPQNIQGVSDAMTWFNPAQSLNLINAMHYQHVKRFGVRKWLVEQGSMYSDEDEAKLLAASEGISHTNGPPEGSVWVVPDPSLSPDMYNLRTVIKNELDTLSGSLADRQGPAAVRGKMTATEAAIIEGKSQVRESDRLKLVTKWAKRCAEKYMGLVTQFVSPEFMEKVLPRELVPWWQEVGKDVMNSEFMVKVRMGSSAYQSKDVRNKQYFDFINLFGDKIDPMTGAPILDLYEAARVGTELMDLPEAKAIILPRPAPAAGQPQGLAPPQMPGGSNGGAQSSPLRSGGLNVIGDLFSNTQNTGARRNLGPNPRERTEQK